MKLLDFPKVSDRAPDHHMVTVAEDLLKRVQAGEFDGIAVVTTSGLFVGTGWDFAPGSSPHTMLGGVSTLNHRLLNEE